MFRTSGLRAAESGAALSSRGYFCQQLYRLTLRTGSHRSKQGQAWAGLHTKHEQCVGFAHMCNDHTATTDVARLS